MSMGMRAKGEIESIVRPRINGMYSDTYYVYYANDMSRKFVINGRMMKKHADFLFNASRVERVETKTGKHIGDRFLK